MPLKTPIQLTLDGIRKLTGVTPIEGNPGMYSVAADKIGRTDRGWINRAIEQLEGKLNPDITSPTAESMLLGVLDTIKKGTLLPGIGKDVKGVVQVSPGGDVVGGAAVDLRKALDELKGIDKTKIPPSLLEYISTTSPEAKGRSIAQQIQELYGDDLVFQVANPKTNVPIYESWGAKPIPRTAGGKDALGGSEFLPAYRIENRVGPRPAEEKLVDPNQLNLPGFCAGGGIQYFDEGGSVLDRQPSLGDAVSEVAGEALGNVGIEDLITALTPVTPLGVGAQLLIHSPEAGAAGVAPPVNLMNKLQQVIARQKGAAGRATNAGNPAWLLSNMSGKHLAAKTPEEAASVARDLQKAREWYDQKGYLTPEVANKLMRSMNRSPVPPSPAMEQLGLGLAHGGSVPHFKDGGSPFADPAFYGDMANRLSAAVTGGAKEWVPDLAGLVGDVPDAAYYLAQKLKSPATPVSLGAGPAVRRGVRRAMGIHPPEQTERGLSEVTDTDIAKTLVQLLNPAMITSPRNIVSGAKAIGRLGAEGIARGVEGEGILGKVLQGAQPQYVVKPTAGTKPPIFIVRDESGVQGAFATEQEANEFITQNNGKTIMGQGSPLDTSNWKVEVSSDYDVPDFASGGYVPIPGTEIATTGTRGYTSDDLHNLIAELEAV